MISQLESLKKFSSVVADTGDICEWSGTEWVIIFDASQTKTSTYVTNLNTNQQFYWNSVYWQFAVDGYYPRAVSYTHLTLPTKA